MPVLFWQFTHYRIVPLHLGLVVEFLHTQNKAESDRLCADFHAKENCHNLKFAWQNM